MPPNDAVGRHLRRPPDGKTIKVAPEPMRDRRPGRWIDMVPDRRARPPPTPTNPAKAGS